VGETITFTLTVQNTGDVSLVTVPLADTFDATYLSYVSAVPSANGSGAGSLSWTDVGPLPVGASTSVVVNFTALASTFSLPETNTVVATPTTPPTEPPVPPQTNDEPYEISSPGFVVAKTLTSPLGRAAAVGETITFTLTVQNTGDVSLVTVPLDDTFDASYLSYLSAVPSADNSGVGTVSWTDVGPLPAGASTSVVVSFAAIGSTVSLPETNTVVATPTTPPTEPPVSPKTNEAPYEISSPGYALTKTLSSPLGRAAAVGEDIEFVITVENTGDVALLTVPLADEFDSTLMAYQFAVPPANSAVPGSLSWNNVGSLPVGSSTQIVVRFLALATTFSLPETNTVTAAPTVPPTEPPVPPQTNVAPYEISSPGYDLIKTIVSPTNRAAVVGEPIVFSLQVINTGDVTLVTVPVEDLYDITYLSYATASIPYDAAAPGALSWTNIGPVLPGNTAEILLTMDTLAITPASQTNVVIASPETPPDEPLVTPKTNDVPYDIVYQSIGDTVWVDLNGNGIPDEDLTVQGLNNVWINLFDLSGGTTSLVGSAMTMTTGGQRGYYLFQNLPFGQYVAVIDLNTVPSSPATPMVNTTPLAYTIPPTVNGSYLIADFGFLPADPTAVKLLAFTAAPVDGGVLLEWETANEFDNMGFRLYRSNTPDGEKVLITPAMIDGLGTGDGQAYTYLDAGVQPGIYYYWLEDVEFNFNTKLHGPVRVDLDGVDDNGTLIASAVLAESGLQVLSGQTIVDAGIPLATLPVANLQVLVNGDPVAAYLTAWGQSLTVRDLVVFYAPAGATVGLTLSESPSRMGMVYAGPLYGDGDVWTGQADEGQVLSFTASDAYIRYLLTGFETSDPWVLDVTDEAAPVLLFGAENIRVEGESGIYLSIPSPDGAACIAVGRDAVHVITELVPAD
ncbi:MAG: DUF11 domain-containing protein, partial [Kiritimatiellae bacterium]|nr:DUF11 domain-containing protein [Kiritimatiellia bacterium]